MVCQTVRRLVIQQNPIFGDDHSEINVNMWAILLPIQTHIDAIQYKNSVNVCLEGRNGLKASA